MWGVILECKEIEGALVYNVQVLRLSKEIEGGLCDDIMGSIFSPLFQGTKYISPNPPQQQQLPTKMSA